MNQEEQAKKWQQIIAKAWMDEGFKQRLLAEPATVLKAGGVEIAPGVEVRMAEDTDKVFNLVLPRKPASEELSDDQLEAVAGGRVVRITNIRANANALAGGSAAGASPVVA